MKHDPVHVLFACVHNAGRSQMAAALFNRFADPAKARAISAGTEPGEKVHPEVVAAMREIGIDLSNQSPQRLTDDLAQSTGVLVTMGCGEVCPVVPGAVRDDWPLEDPKGRPIERVREIRDEIAERVLELLVAKSWLPVLIRRAQSEDRPAVEALLRVAQLPLQGVEENLATFFVADQGGKLVGVAGLEVYGEHALLRSVAVEPRMRGHGVGSALTLHVLRESKALGVRELYLLTTTACDFFAKRGFDHIERAQVPVVIARAPEFADLCPASAIAMRRVMSE